MPQGHTSRSGGRSRRRVSDAKSHTSTGASKQQQSESEYPEGVYESESEVEPPPPSFLFAVDGLTLNEDYTNGGVTPRVDGDGLWLPPVYSAGFGGQNPGTIYRWNGGDISTSGIPNASSLQLYKMTTMFWCNSFRQFVAAHGDATTRDIANEDLEHQWHPINFHHEETLSRIDYAGELYLVGNRATFSPQLGLTSYESNEDDAPIAEGLAGDLAMLVALVAFSCKRRELSRVLIDDRAWSSYRWMGHNRSPGRKHYFRQL